MKNSLFITLFIFLFSANSVAQSYYVKTSQAYYKEDTLKTFDYLKFIAQFIKRNDHISFKKMVRSYPRDAYTISNTDTLIVNMAFDLIYKNRDKYPESFARFIRLNFSQFTKSKFDDIYNHLTESHLNMQRNYNVYPFDYFIKKLEITESLVDSKFIELKNLAQNYKHFLIEPYDTEVHLISNMINQGKTEIEDRLLELIQREINSVVDMDWNNFETRKFDMYYLVFQEIYSISFWIKFLKVILPISSKSRRQSSSVASSIEKLIKVRLNPICYEQFKKEHFNKKNDYPEGSNSYEYKISLLRQYMIDNKDCWGYIMHLEE